MNINIKNENININNDKNKKRSLSDIDDNNNNAKIIKKTISIEKPILKKNDYVKKNPLALIIPDSLYREDILLSDLNKCNCSYMAELYELYGQNVQKITIICNHNSNSKIVTP
jgi:UTP-glucose-1-phosphate uridylyltransferase